MSQPLRLASLTATPAAGFEQPFEMLEACHERIRRTLALLERLRAHLRQHGADAQARQAAHDVMRYFDRAAPEHHRDEELHVFPPLLAQGEPARVALVSRLVQEHRAMEAGWDRARTVLARVAQGGLTALAATDDAALDGFAGLYAGHLAAEEALAYPAARPLLAPQSLQAMAAEMGGRRGLAAPPAVGPAVPSSGASPKIRRP